MATGKNTQSALILVGLSLLWGSSWMAEQGVAVLGAACALAAIRYALAALILILITALSMRKTPPLDALWLRANLLLGATMLGAPALLLIWSGQHGSGSFAPLVYAALPLGLLLAGGHLRTPAMIAPGAMLVLLNGSLPLSLPHLVWVLPIFVAVALQGWALWFAQRRILQAASFSGVALQCATAALMLAAASLLRESPPRLQPVSSWAADSTLCILLLSGLGVALAYPLYYRLLRNICPTQAATCQWMQTLVAVAESALVMRRAPTGMMWFSGVTLLACAWLMLRPNQAQIAALELG